MSYDEIHRVTEIERVANRRPSHFDMDAACCGRMHAAAAAGLESAPTGVVTTPGTKNPFVPGGAFPPNLGHPIWVAFFFPLLSLAERAMIFYDTIIQPR
jgi:hypothetical protein